MYFKLALSSLFLFIILSCSEPTNTISKFGITKSDSIVRDLPDRFKKDSSRLQNILKFDSLLNLEPIVNGFNGTQIRLWISCASERVQKLIVLRKNKIGWNASFYSYKSHLNDFGYFAGVSDVNKESKNPRSGWQTFYDSLINTDILELPDHSKFADKYSVPFDAQGVGVEIGLPNKYRLYTYPEPGLNAKRFKEPAKLVDALRLIERQFNYNCYCE